MAKLYWRHKKDGKWTFTAYEGFDDVWNLYTIKNIVYDGWNVYQEEYAKLNSDAAEMMILDYRRIIALEEEE